jgi:hypothetical protein
MKIKDISDQIYNGSKKFFVSLGLTDINKFCNLNRFFLTSCLESYLSNKLKDYYHVKVKFLNFLNIN